MSKRINPDHSLKLKDTAQVNQDHLKIISIDKRSDTPWVIIPARLGARRLPEKPLLDLCGRPLIARVVESVSASIDSSRIVVVSDEESVLEASTLAKPPPGQTLIIDAPCHSGSERVRRAYQEHPHFASHRQHGEAWLLNVQGDEPLLPEASLTALIEALPYFEHSGIHIATLAAPLPENPEEVLHNRAAVKACLSRAQSDAEHLREALYFSRAPIGGHLHIGVYAFHSSILDLIATPRTPLAIQEDLEQLTWMECGARIGVVCLDAPHPSGVDTIQDLERARSLYEQRRSDLA